MAVFRKVRGMDYEALFRDVLELEQKNAPSTHYALMGSTLNGEYVVKYLRSHSPSHYVAKQDIERQILAQIRTHRNLRCVCQSLAPNSVIASIASFVRARFLREYDRDDDMLLNFESRLTVSLNWKKRGFADLRNISQNARVSVYAGVVIHRLVADALQKLHSVGIYHGDVHDRNVLYKVALDGYVEIRLIDFDLSRIMSRTNRLAPLGGRTIVDHRVNYNINYSYANYVFTNTTQLLVNNVQRIHANDRIAYDKMVRKVAELRGLVSLPGRDRSGGKISLVSFISKMSEWTDCTAWWPTSVRGVSTFCRYDARRAETLVLRVVVDARRHDSDLFAHEICMARESDGLVRSVDLNLHNVPDVFQYVFANKFKIVKGVPLELAAYGCLLALRVRGHASQSLTSPHEIMIDGNKRSMMVNMARLMPSANNFASQAAYAQYQKTHGRFIKHKVSNVN